MLLLFIVSFKLYYHISSKLVICAVNLMLVNHRRFYRRPEINIFFHDAGFVKVIELLT